MDAEKRSDVSSRWGTTPHFDLLPAFAQRHGLPLPPGFDALLMVPASR